jgi:hypothetical protein
MILYPRTDQEYEDTLRLLRVIEMLRRHGPGYNPPVVDDAPWVRTYRPNPKYL